MKMSGYILLVLIVGLVFAVVASILSDFETQYPDVIINKSWEEQYDYADEINESIISLKDKFDIIGDEDIGWFSKLAAGITAVPIAIVTVPVVLFKTISYGITIITSLGTEIGVPAFVTYFAVIAILIIIVFALVSFWHRGRA